MLELIIKIMNNKLKTYLYSLKVREKYFLDFEDFVFSPFVKVIV
jgi:hypothetical protein